MVRGATPLAAIQLVAFDIIRLETIQPAAGQPGQQRLHPFPLRVQCINPQGFAPAGREPRLRSLSQKQLPLINRRQKKRVEALDEKSD
jgi:hypothetical protein